MPLTAQPVPLPAPDAGERRRIGVIDIGSNSIRLVVFSGASRSPLPIFNEKVLCGMGRRLHSTGRLDPEGVELALGNLPRFAAAAEALGVERLRVVGTAAIRDAQDGPAFIARVREVAGLRIDIISGETEARLSAMGLISALPDADGAMGDLGGGSLELVRLDKGTPGPQVTLPLGPLRLNEAEREGENIGKLIKETLQGLRWLPSLEDRNFYAIGGAWRALARIHQAHTGYRLRVIDGYRVDADAFRDFLQLIGKMSDAALKQLPDVPAKRLDTLRPASRILRHIVNIGRPRGIVFSAQGLREGIIFEDLSESRRKEDPLLAAAADIARHFGRFARLGPTLARWTEALFRGESRSEKRLREAACLLSDIGWVDHPDYRGRLVFERALTMPLPGLDHGARAFIAHALHARYEDEPGNRPRKTAAALGLADDAVARARAVGQTIRLGYTVATGREEALAKTSLAAGEKLLILSVPRLDGTYAGESVSKRLDQLARSLGLSPRIAVRGT
ncbi:MAG: Ppx/GppA family phosphatase [Rhodospirillaceae bacterium]|nr:Ppx/GppA family phosphatase [Rhodospirillaceae bacterium]